MKVAAFTLVLAAATVLCSASTLQRAKRGVDDRDNDGLSTALQGETAINRCKDKSVVNLVDESGNTVLHLAAHFGSSTIVSGLLDSGANAGALNKDKQTPLHWAAKKGHEAAVEILLNQEGIDINAVDKDDQTALHGAAYNGHEAVVQELVQHDDIRIDAKTKYQHTPLHLAAKEGHSSVVAVLLQSGANINAQDQDLQTPLQWAARNGHKAVVQELLQHDDIQIEVKTEIFQNTPLHLAAKTGHSSVVAVMLQSGANSNAQDYELRTPLHWAAIFDYKAVVQELLQHREIIINPRDKWGRTPLFYAESRNRAEIVQLLKERGGTE